MIGRAPGEPNIHRAFGQILRARADLGDRDA